MLPRFLVQFPARSALLLLALSTVGCNNASGAGLASSPPVLPQSAHPLNGNEAPNFELQLYNSQTESLEGSTSLQSLRGRVVVLDFWATWCKPCKASFPKYQQLQAQYGEQLAILAISEDDETEGVSEFVAETGINFDVAWDPDKQVARRYQIQGMPTLFIIDKHGVVQNVHNGYRPGDEYQIGGSIEATLRAQ